VVERCRRCTSGRQQERRRAAVSCPSRARLLTHMQQVRVWDHLPIPELPVAGDDRIWLGIGCRRMMFRVWLGIARAAAVRDDRIRDCCGPLLAARKTSIGWLLISRGRLMMCVWEGANDGWAAVFADYRSQRGKHRSDGC